jgi:transcriptional regulator with XRE-family HTH domain
MFGEKLKTARLAAGMTQEELAEKCGMKKQSISRYENSEREPNIRTAKKLADALNISLESLAVESLADLTSEQEQLITLCQQLNSDQIDFAKALLKQIIAQGKHRDSQ